MAKKKSAKKKGKKVYEIFEIEKSGKEKVKETLGTEENKQATKKQIEQESKILRNLLLGIGIFIFMIILIVFLINSVRHFEYEGIKFEIVKEGSLIFYKTSIPVMYNGEEIPYDFYLRNDPRKLDVPVDEKINFRENMVLEVTTEDLFCEGDWSIATGNLMNLYGILGVNLLVKNESKSYEPEDKYMFVKIQPANITSIEKTGDNSYNLNVNNCEILKVAEKLMLETFIRYHEVN